MAIALIRNNRKPKSRKASTNNYTSQDIETAFEKKDSYGKDDKYSDE
jgi:hypothetical protein